MRPAPRGRGASGEEQQEEEEHPDTLSDWTLSSIIGQSAQRAGRRVVSVVVIIVVIVAFGHCAGPLYTDTFL